MSFEHTASGTGTDQELLDLNRAMQARILANGQEYRTAEGKWVKLPDLEMLREQEKELQARIAASDHGPADNFVEFQRRRS